MRVNAYAPVQRVVGVLLALISVSFLPPMVVSWVVGDGIGWSFVVSFLLVSGVGGLLYWPVRQADRDLRISDGFLVVVACWAAVCLAGSLPFVLGLEASLADAIFESTSGITTTGATVFSGLDAMPVSILWYRQQLQWMGGLGIIILAVAILPMLRVGGMQVYKAEATGPMKENRLTPKIAETAKALWLIYIALTIICAAAYWAAGMSAFDALMHSFSTIATAGFSTHDASIGHFNSPLIEWLVIVFVFIASLNFALHFLALRRASMQVYLKDPELKLFAALVVLISVLVTVLLWRQDVSGGFWAALRTGAFHTVSYITTTGFATEGVYLWPGTLPLLLLMISALGGARGRPPAALK